MPMAGYTKLFNSILASTIWREDDKTRLVWITLLAMADKNGVAEGSLPGLADFARVSIPDCQRALERLSAPDCYSRSQVNEGRRIEVVEGGWRLINHPKYRAQLSADERREYNRVKQAEHRQKLSANVKNVIDVKERKKGVPKKERTSEAEAEAEAKAEAEATSEADPKAKDQKRTIGAHPAPRRETTTPEGFETFWAAYPRRIGKGAARSEWAKLRPSAELQARILAAVEQQRMCDQWVKEGGQFVPHPRTWLHQQRWDDSPDMRASMITNNPKTAGNLAAMERWVKRKAKGL